MNLFNRLKFDYFFSIFIENNIELFKFYKIDYIFNKREI